jgi:hypothetical protein
MYLYVDVQEEHEQAPIQNDVVAEYNLINMLVNYYQYEQEQLAFCII